MKRNVVFVVLVIIAGFQIWSLNAEVNQINQIVSDQERLISILRQQLDQLSQTVRTQDAKIAAQESTLSAREIRISNLETQNVKLEGDVRAAQAEATKYREQTTSLSSRLNKILDITVTQNYHWEYQWRPWSWDLPISLSLYVEFKERQRPRLGSDYVSMAKDPKDDLYIDRIVQHINDAAVKQRFTETQKINFTIAFVQSLPYTVDEETTPYDEYPRYPIETLFDRGGDCEDTSILIAAILDRMGFDVALLLLRDAQHMAVGIALADTYGSYYDFNSKKYFYLETTGDGWEIGEIPPDITQTKAAVHPLRS
ncbi:MAG: hypothetical protein HY667_05600 [Chloroflexi bacterium]|nr:hypothetical protein [Chloroflexota bacterium]